MSSSGGVWRSVRPSWVLGNARLDTALSNITLGSLYSYTLSIGIYKCPADKSRTDNGKSRIRSYSIPLNLGGGGFTQIIPPFMVAQRLTEIPYPGHGKLTVFIDVSAETIDSSDYAVQLSGNSFESWLHLPTGRHGRRGNLSFTDGHVETWEWRYRKDGRPQGDSFKGSDDCADFDRLTSGAARNTEGFPGACAR